jgi:hypothetical protein
LVALIETDLTDDRGDSVALDYFELSTEGVPPGALPITDSSPITSPDPVEPAPVVPEPVEPDPIEQDPVEKDPIEQKPPAQPAPGSQGSNSSDPYKLPGWIAQFSFDEGTGPVTADTSSSGDQHQGALRGKARWAQGIKGNAIDILKRGGNVEVTNSASINLDTHEQRTVSVWFNADRVSKSSGKQVIYEEGGSTRGLNIYLDDDKLFVGGWNRAGNESGWSGTWLETDDVSADKWHHVSLVLDGDGKLAPNALRGYLDGEQFGVGAGSQLWGRGDGTGIGGVTGATRFKDGKTKGGSLAGLVDEVSIFNDALSVDQIETLANPNLL